MSHKLSRNQDEYLKKWDEDGISHVEWGWGYNFYRKDGTKSLFLYGMRGITRTTDALLRAGILVREGKRIVLKAIPEVAQPKEIL